MFTEEMKKIQELDELRVYTTKPVMLPLSSHSFQNYKYEKGFF